MPSTNPQLKIVMTQRLYDRLDKRFRESKDRSLAETARKSLDLGIAITEEGHAFLDRYAVAHGLLLPDHTPDRPAALAAILAAAGATG